MNAASSPTLSSTDTDCSLPSPPGEIPDIEAVSGRFLYGSYQMLPQALNNVRACRFFCGQLQANAAIDRQEGSERAEWFLRAALGEFRAILDSIGRDVSLIPVFKRWEGSEQAGKVRSHHLIRVLRGLERPNAHPAVVPERILQDHGMLFGEECGPQEGRSVSLFFGRVDQWDPERPVDATERELAWFNRQAAVWPACLLLDQAIYEVSVQVWSFFYDG
jgi:hypothetical protein